MKIFTQFRLILLLEGLNALNCICAVPQLEIAGKSTYSHILSSDDVTAFVMDHHKIMWIGTSFGLNLYDGYAYKQFFHDDSDSTSIPANSIRTLFHDSKNRTWIGTDNGIAYYKGNGRFRSYSIAHSICGIIQITETSNGEILANNGEHIYIFDNKRFREIYTFDIPLQYRGYLYNNKMCPDKFGGVWLITPYDCLYYDKHKRKGKRIVNTQSANMAFATGNKNKAWITQSRNLICLDLNTQEVLYEYPLSILPTLLLKEGNHILLSSGRHGLFTFNTQTHDIKFISEQEFPLKKHHTQISSFYVDANKNLWIGFHNGGLQVLSELDRKIIATSHNQLIQNTLDRRVSALTRSKNNQIWGATDTHIFCYTPKTDKISFFEQNKIFYDSPYFRQSLLKISVVQDTVWFLTNVRIVRCSYHKNSLKVERSINIGPLLGDFISANNTNYIISESKHLYIQARNSDGIDSISIKHPLYNGRTRLLHLSSGKILLYMENMNIMVFDPHTYTMETVLPQNKYQTREVTPTVAFEDSKKRIWLGSKGHGLFQLNLNQKKIREIQSLPSMQIMSIMEDSIGNLWIGTRQGIMTYSPEKNESYLYAMKTKDGDKFGVFNEQSSCSYPNNMLLFGGNNGCVIIPPSLIQQKAAPCLTIREIRVRKKGGQDRIVKGDILNKSHFTFSHDESDLEISFGGINYGDTPLYLYEYKMDGFDHSWNYAGRDHQAPYSNLPTGHYTFRVHAMQALHSQIIEEESIEITILPSPWLSTPAIICYIILLVLLFLYINYLYLRIHSNRIALEVASHEKERELRTNKMNMNFFANISHEFRNPLSMIAGPITTLYNDSSLPFKIHQKLSVINQSVNQMLRLIDQMLDFNQLENDVLKLKVSQYDIIYEINNLTNIFTINAQERNITFIKEGLDDSCFTWLDYDKLDKILSNILTNALKHTPDNGEIRLQFKVISDKETMQIFKCEDDLFRGNYIYISIYNNGEQIPRDKLTEVFKRYYQIKEIKETHNRGWGTGIGLYYVQRLVNLHHGYIQADNAPNGGVVFSFTLPMSEEAYATNEHIQKEKETPDTDYEKSNSPKQEELVQIEENQLLQKPRLLIVDDDIPMARYLKSIFNNDYQVVNKYSAESALIEIAHTIPDVILSDVIMGKMSGYDFCRAIKGDVAYCHIPFILITARSTTSEQIEGLELGANAYVTKPFDPDYLQALVRSQLKNSELIRKSLNEHTQVQTMEGELSSRDKAFVKELYGLMEKHLSDLELNINNICEELHISRSKFNYKIKGLTGNTPNNFFKQYKLNHAAQLLKEGKYNVSEVAMMTGFGTISYFSISFKKQFGINPSEYK